jgi:hypothetical protein
MICLGPQREQWQPEKECDCKYTIHKKCWDQWEKQSHGDCLICRDEKQKKRREMHYQLVLVEPDRLPRIIYTGVFVLFLGLFAMFIIMISLAFTFKPTSIKDEL